MQTFQVMVNELSNIPFSWPPFSWFDLPSSALVCYPWYQSSPGPEVDCLYGTWSCLPGHSHQWDTSLAGDWCILVWSSNQSNSSGLLSAKVYITHCKRFFNYNSPNDRSWRHFGGPGSRPTQRQSREAYSDTTTLDDIARQLKLIPAVLSCKDDHMTNICRPANLLVANVSIWGLKCKMPIFGWTE